MITSLGLKGIALSGILLMSGLPKLAEPTVAPRPIAGVSLSGKTLISPNAEVLAKMGILLQNDGSIRFITREPDENKAESHLLVAGGGTGESWGIKDLAGVQVGDVAPINVTNTDGSLRYMSFTTSDHRDPEIRKITGITDSTAHTPWNCEMLFGQEGVFLFYRIPEQTTSQTFSNKFEQFMVWDPKYLEGSPLSIDPITSHVTQYNPSSHCCSLIITRDSNEKSSVTLRPGLDIASHFDSVISHGIATLRPLQPPTENLVAVHVYNDRGATPNDVVFWYARSPKLDQLLANAPRGVVPESK